MHSLNLPEAPLRIRKSGSGEEVFDICRRKWVSLTPEEFVRQHLLHYFTAILGYPEGLIAVEKELPGSGRSLRADIVVFNGKGSPALVVEVKSSSVPVNTDVFSQAARYNARLGVPFLAISNGRDHYCAHIDYLSNTYEWLTGFPGREELED